MDIKKTNPVLSIGVPVHNGGKFLQKALESILSQTFTDYEIIISNNASSDFTEKICKENQNKDNRIKYFHQKQYVDWVENYNFVLEKAKGKYFVWLSADDYWEPTFLEKNIEILDLNQNVVGSTSDVKLFGKMNKNLKPLVFDNSGKQEKHQYVIPIKGTYDKKVKTFLEFGWVVNMYSVFRTKILQKSMIKGRPFVVADFTIILNVLKYGDLEVVDEFLSHRSTEGWTSTESFIDLLKKEDVGIWGIIFPYAKFTKWCLKNLGLKLVLKNWKWFLIINYRSERKIFHEFLEKIKKN